MLRNRLIELRIGITELSEFLSISRPTLYKFVDLYDNGQNDKIPLNYKQLFDYICENKLINRINVINYIMNKLFSFNKQNINVNLMNNFILMNENDQKYKFIKYIMNNNDLDEIILLLYEIVVIKKTDKSLKSNKNKEKIEKIKKIILEEINE